MSTHAGSAEALMSNAEALTKSLLEVLGLEETFGNTPQMTITLILLAVAASVAGDHAGALGWLGKAIVRARDIGYWVGARSWSSLPSPLKSQCLVNGATQLGFTEPSPPVYLRCELR